MTLVESYFQAWNSRDPDAVPGVFAEGGTYTDPTITGPPLPAPDLAGHVPASSPGRGPGSILDKPRTAAAAGGPRWRGG